LERNISNLFLLTIFIAFFASCNRFKDETSLISNPMIGKWQLDSIALGTDTSLAFILTLIAMNEDPAGVNFEFTKDSIFTRSKNDTDIISYKFDAATKHIFTKENANEQALLYARLNDSLSSIRINDSAVFFIKRR
jgi:hypothetical protein